MRATALASALAFSLAGLGLLLWEAGARRAELAERLDNQARTLGAGTTAALEFGDAALAGTLLEGLARNEEIELVALYDAGGALFAHRGDGLVPPDRAPLVEPSRIRGRLVRGVHAVEHEGDIVGSLLVVANLDRLRAHDLGSAFAVAVMCVLGALFALGLAERLLLRITEPIERLGRIAREVSTSQNYALRAGIDSDDEIGDLGSAVDLLLERIERDTDLDEQRRALQAEVVERERVNRKLRAERERAEAASRAKSEFLANMSHEIRTPMNGVLGMTELLLRSGLRADQERLAHTAYRSAVGLLDVINAILDISRMEAGKLTIHPRPFRLIPLVEDVVSQRAAASTDQGLEWVVDVAPECPDSLMGDALRISQVLINLLGNACKFTSRGSIVTRVRVEARADDGVVLRFEVEDTGIGISDDAQQRIFSSFEQADGSTTRRFGGTGLGLTICRNLVELMKGRIGVHSRLGEGSTFWFSLPLGETEDLAEPPPGSLPGARLLIVDDSAVNREVLERQSARWAVESASVCNADEALDALRRASREGKPYAVALIDLDMPEVDGLALARRIRADEALRDTRLILLSSAVIDPRSAGDAEQLFDSSLTKPVRLRELRGALAGVLQGGGSPSSRAQLPEAVYEPLGLTVLLAEDNPVNQLVAQELLEILGCTVEIVESGEKVSAAVQQGAFDVVLMDCQMPIMSGFDATRALREAGSDIPVIAVTANAMREDQQRCREAGMQGYLAKPFRLEDLAAALRAHVPGADGGPARG